jgi:hypothetical protein
MLPQLPGKAEQAALDPFFAQLNSGKIGNGFGGETLAIVEQEDQLVPIRCRNPVHQLFYFPEKNPVLHGIFLGCGLQGGVKFGLTQ